MPKPKPSSEPQKATGKSLEDILETLNQVFQDPKCLAEKIAVAAHFTTFDSIYQNPTMRKGLQSHIKSIYADELFNFYEAVKDYKETTDEDKRVELGKKIVTEYLRDNSPQQINISSQDMAIVETSIASALNDGKAPLDQFDFLATQVSNLMSGTNQDFTEFRQSDFFNPAFWEQTWEKEGKVLSGNISNYIKTIPESNPELKKELTKINDNFNNHLKNKGNPIVIICNSLTDIESKIEQISSPATTQAAARATHFAVDFSKVITALNNSKTILLSIATSLIKEGGISESSLGAAKIQLEHLGKPGEKALNQLTSIQEAAVKISKPSQP